MKKITQEFINHVKLLSSLRPIPPVYNPNEWEGSFNCYMYALNINTNFIGYRTNPGFLVEEIKQEFAKKEGLLDYNKKNLIQLFKEDCKQLKLKVIETTLNEKVDSDEYKIAVYLNSNGGYHFVRKDIEGGWSEKNGWCGSIEIINEEDIDKSIHGFTFVGVYKVSRKE